MALPELTWLSRTGPEFWMMSLMSVMLVLKSPTIAWVAVDQPLQGGTQPADGLCCLVEQLADLVLGQHGKPAVRRI